MSPLDHAAEASSSSVDDDEIELEWEEWDGKSPFLHHCVAGSVAGVAEHTLLYPVDTVKTHIMSYCADCPVQNHNNNGAANANNHPRGRIGTNPTTGAAAGGGSSGRAHNNLARWTKAPKASATPPPTAAAAAGPQQRGILATMRNLVEHGHASSSSASAATRRVVSVASSGGGAVSAEAAYEEVCAAAARQRQQRFGVFRLWRGVQTMIVGCVPAHALYFSSYEAIKSAFLAGGVGGGTAAGQRAQNLGPVGSSVAGASAAFCHDLVMTPLDTVKQRMQLGHYRSMGDAIRTIVAGEGAAGLYRSFPVTLMTNLPYGMIMVSTNEFLRETLKRSDGSSRLDIQTTMLAGCGAGTAAAAVTTPLDRLKTRLQTQRLGTAIAMQAAASGVTCENAPLSGSCPKARAERALISGELRPRYDGWADALRSIVREEGYGGLFRGMTPRLITHAPAVAISWTTYEAAKRWLAENMM